MSRPLLTLTTDFGEGSPYVAQMKAVILALNPTVQIVDITHSIAPQSILHGAIVLRDVTFDFPPDCLHIAVIDPGVGTDRPIVYARIGSQNYIAPDNGLLHLLAEAGGCTKVVRLSEPRYWNPEVSATFHGRDIMAPAAAHLSLGLPPEHLGPAAKFSSKLEWPKVRREADRIHGQVVATDHFGNLITNIHRSTCPATTDDVVVEIGRRSDLRLARTYGEHAAGTLVALFGSSQWLEIAEVCGNAARRLELGPGTPVAVQLPKGGDG